MDVNDYSRFTYALGTTNQAKRTAVVLATGKEPICLSVPSGVSEQPMTEAETIEGAIHRARQVLSRVPEAQIGLGLEGGLTFDERYTNRWYLISVCAAWDGERLSLGKGLAFPLPTEVGERLRKEGIELRTIIDEWSGMSGSNHKGGAYGLFTDDRIRRAEVFHDAVIAAVTPFVSRFYK
jgi:inosine/xanthosine triphosphatase